jgi:hypothetical protein
MYALRSFKGERNVYFPRGNEVLEVILNREIYSCLAPLDIRFLIPKWFQQMRNKTGIYSYRGPVMGIVWDARQFYHVIGRFGSIPRELNRVEHMFVSGFR